MARTLSNDSRPGRWPGLLVWFLLFAPISALAADAPLQFQSPDGRRTVSAAERAVADHDRRRARRRGVAHARSRPAISSRPSRTKGSRRPSPPKCASPTTTTRSTSASSATTRRLPALIVNDIRKDFAAGEQDSFELILDTFADRRNGFVFVVNPAGAEVGHADRERRARRQHQLGRRVDGGDDARTPTAGRRRSGFRSRRCASSAARIAIWGVNFSRRIRRKNEVDYWSPVPRVYNLYRAGLAGTLAGLPRREPGAQPAGQAVDRRANATRGLGGDGFDNDGTPASTLKYGVTPSLTLDVTVKPDFAQAEADEQQVNLTQFSLFFPEKREFFLENSGMFYFGDIPRESRLGNARFAPPEEEMLLFFSRRIGLTDTGEEIPIAAGGRLTGRVGGTGVGAMTIQTQAIDGRAGDNYTVLRGRRDILRNSDVGAIFLSRQSAGASRTATRSPASTRTSGS